MKQAFRIIEWTSEFKDGSRKVEFELLRHSDEMPDSWEQLGTSRTLEWARKAPLFYASNDNCWSS
jgi:hypothetical protein